MHKRAPFFVLSLFFAATGAAQAQPKVPEAGALPPFPRFAPSVRLMTGFERVVERPTLSQGGFREENTGFFLQQARVKLEGQLSDPVGFEVSLDLADAMTPAVSTGDLTSPPYIRNALIDVRVVRELKFKAGRFKRPFSRLELASAGDLPIRGRGLFSDLAGEEGQWGDRSLGFSAYGRFKAAHLRWELAAMDPTWAPDVRRRGVDVFARLTYDPFKWLSVGVAGGYKTVTLTERTIRAAAGTLDLEVTHKGLYALAAAQFAELPFEAGTPGSFSWVGLLSYDIPLSPDLVLQPAAFFEYADAHAKYLQTEAVRVVGGTNVILFEQLRIMPQLEVVNPLGQVSEFNPWAAKTAYYLLLSLEI